MTADQNQTGLAQDLLRIHRVITRALTVTLARGAEFMQTGFPDAGLRKGYTDYTKSLAVVLDGHHVGEDEVAFPLLKEKITCRAVRPADQKPPGNCHPAGLAPGRRIAAWKRTAMRPP